MTKQIDKGYLLPETIPETLRCMKIWVPDDDLAIAAFWGSLEYLSKWLAWERTDDHRGADMAAVWYEAVQASRDTCQEGCGIMDVRQSQDAPCTLEKTTDGEVWEQFADLTLCPPYPPPSTTDTADLTDNMLWAIYQVMQEIVDVLDASGTIVEAAQAGAVLSRQVLGSGLLIVWSHVAELVDTYTPTERTELMDFDTWEPARDEGYCNTTEEPPPSEDYPNWLEALAGGLIDFMNSAANILAETLNDVAAYLFNGQVLSNADYGSGGGGAGFGWSDPACPGFVEFDLTAESAGLLNYDCWDTFIDRGSGSWVDTEGWATEDHLVQEYSGQWRARREMMLRLPFDQSSNITRIEATIDFTKGTYNNTGIDAWRIGLIPEDHDQWTVYAHKTAAELSGPYTDYVYAVDIDVTIDHIAFSFITSYDWASPWTYSGYCRFTHLKIHYKGQSPFT